MMERCICGAAMRDVAAAANAELEPGDRREIWTHVHGADTRCNDPRRIADIIPDRALTQAAAQQLAELSDRNRRAAGELENLQSQVAELSEVMETLASSLTFPGTIRRSVLMEVWDELVTAGDLAGARVVHDMLKAAK